MYGLKQEDIQKIIEVFKKYSVIEKVFLYGSRAKGNYKPHSDIDLTLVGNELNISNQFAIETELDDLLLPYKIDLSIYHKIENQDLLDHIDRVGILFYKNDELSDWQEQRLDEFSNINPRESLPKGKIAKKVPMEALQTFTKKIPEFYLEEFKGGVKFKNGDTLMARITPSLENGKTSFVDFLEDDEIGFGSTEFIVLRAKEGISNSHFLYYLAISPDLREIAIQSMTGSSGRQRVQTDVVKEYYFLFPPLKEQKAIAEVLTCLDDKIDLLHRENHTLEAMAETLFRLWLIVEEKEEWQQESLSSIATFLNGLACQKYPPKNETEKLPVLKIRELKEGFTDNSDWASTEVDKKYFVSNGDVIFSWSASLVVKIWDGADCILNQHLFKVTSEDYPKWFYYLWSRYHLKQFIAIAKAHATTMGHIKRGDLDDAMVAIPSSKELEEMSKTFSPMIDKLISNNKQIKTLEKTRDTLLPKLMSGDIRVTH